jgi:pimeloyl-ACP methyl ester carboxylesterase
MRSTEVDAGGRRWSVLDAGGDGPVVLLLHGYPDGKRTWEPILPGLTTAGYRPVAADLPGFGGTDPLPGLPGVVSLADAVAALAVRLEATTVVGHDWGGVATWCVAAMRPETAGRYVVVNAPHPTAFPRTALRRPVQLARSAYMVPISAGLVGLPLARRLYRAAYGGPPPAAALAALEEGLATRANRRAAANYYRAALTGWLPGRGHCGAVPADRPLLLLAGCPDPALDAALFRASLDRYAPHGRLVEIPQGYHFPHWRQPAVVLAHLLEHLAGA